MNPADKDTNKATTARELLIEQYFLPFLASHLRDQKTDAFTFCCNPEMNAQMQELKLNVNATGQYELHKLTKEQWTKFRHYFIEKRCFNQNWIKNPNQKVMDLLLSSLALIMCKKVPAELELKKVEKLFERVKLLVTPEFEARSDACVVRLQLPRDDNGDEFEQDNKAVAVNSRPNTLPYTTVVLN